MIRRLLAILSVVLLVTACTGKPTHRMSADEMSAETAIPAKDGSDGAAAYNDFNLNAPDPFDDPDDVKEFDPDEPLRTDSDVSAITVNYYNPDDFDMSGFVFEEDDAVFTVVDSGPHGMLPNEMTKNPTIFCVFSHPVVPLSKLGDPLRSSPYMRIEPAVEGVFRWYGSKMLAFEPTERILPQKEYRVTVSGVKSLSGKQLEGEHTFSFFTEYLDIVSAFPWIPGGETYIDPNDIPIRYTTKFTVQLSYPFDLELMKEYLVVTIGGESHLFTLSRFEGFKGQDNLYERTCVINFDRELPENTSVVIGLKRGARSYRDSIGRQTGVSRAFNTIKPFRFLQHDTYSYSFPRSQTGDSNPLFLTFSHPVNQDVKRLARLISVSLPVGNLEENIQVFNNTVRLNNLPVVYNSTYTVTLSGGIEDIYGRKLGEERTIQVETKRAASYAYFRDSGFKMLEAAFPPKTILEFQNVKDGMWNIDRIENPLRCEFPSYVPFDLSDQKPDTKHYRTIDLTPYLNEDGFGAVAMRYKLNTPYYRDDEPQDYYVTSKLTLQVTDLGLTVRYAYNRAVVLVRSLSTGAPAAGASVELLGSAGDQPVARGVTDEKGLCVLPIDEYRFANDSENWYTESGYHINGFIVKVTNGSDSVYFRPGTGHNRSRFSPYATSNPRTVTSARVHTLLFTDRGLYKPGERMVFRGISQARSTGSFRPLQGNYSIVITSRYYSNDEKYVMHRASGTHTASGGFSGEFVIPKTTAPGTYYIQYRSEDINTVVSFQVSEFKRAEFEVSIKPSDVTVFAGDKISLTGQARYLSGGAMAGASGRAVWMRSGGAFSPKTPEFKDYVYGPDLQSDRRTLGSTELTLDGNGTAALEQVTGSEHAEGLTYTYTTELYVRDISRQELTCRQSVTVHPGAFYLGAKIASKEVKGWWSRYLRYGDPVKLEIVPVAPDEKRYERKMTVRAELIRKEWKSSVQTGVYGRMNYRWEQVETVEDSAEVTFSGIGSVTFKPEKAGQYVMRLRAEDPAGRKIRTDLPFYVTGSQWINWGLSSPDAIELVPDRTMYAPGDTARVLVKSPLPEGEYLLTLEREGILEERLVTLNGSAAVIEIPIAEDHVPVVYVALCTGTERKEAPVSYFETDLGKPKGYFGMVSLRVSTETRELDVRVESDKELYKPGEEAEVKIYVSKNGVPVQNAEVTFLAVDRGVLDLIDYHVPNPVSFFYNPRNFPHAVLGGDSRSLLVDPITYEIKDLVGGDAKDDLTKREDFRPLAVFEPFLTTDKNGVAVARFTFPDTLTTYRSTAFVVERDRFGYTEQELFVRNPVTVRTAMPQAMRLRDQSDIGVIMTNLTGEPRTLSVTAESDILRLMDGPTKEVRLGANETLEVPFRFLAVKEGEATLRFTVRSDVLNEILIQRLEVQYPVNIETFTIPGTTGGVKDGERDRSVEAFIYPRAVDPGYGGVTLTLTTNPFASVGNAASFLHYYPWYWSIYDDLYRVFPHMLFGKDISRIAPGISYSNEFQRRLRTLLPKHRFRDGGFISNPEYMNKVEESDLWLTLLVAQYQGLARIRNRSVMTAGEENEMLNFIQQKFRDDHLPLSLRARILYILSLFDRDVAEWVSELMKAGDELGMEGYLYCGLAYLQSGQETKAGELLDYSRKFIKVGTRTVDFVESYEARSYWDSPVHRLALMNLLYYRLRGVDDMMISFSNTINRAERHGYWDSVIGTVWVLVAAAEVSRLEATSETELDAEVTLGDIELWKTRFSGIQSSLRTETYPLFREPLLLLERDKPYPLSFTAEGTGRLFYSASFRYALPAEIVSARDEGIGVFRSVYTLDGERVTAGELELGETYRMKVVLSTTKTRYDVGLRVPIPSGCDVLDSSFVTTGSYSAQGGTDSRSWTRETVYGDETSYVGEGVAYYYGAWRLYAYGPSKRIYKNEVSYRFGTLYRGQQTIDFLFRVTTPGIYPTPPAYAEVLDEPEVFGRSEGLLFRVEKK